MCCYDRESRIFTFDCFNSSEKEDCDREKMEGVKCRFEKLSTDLK